VGWGLILIVIAIASKTFTKSVLNTALTIASLPYGAMLGAFLLGVLTKKANQRGVMTGMAVALGVMLFIWLKTPLAWTWYVLTGTIICSSVGYLVSLVTASSSNPEVASEGDAVTG
jgi:Na+/proline symporter